jgi:hypothetical protein
MKFTSKYDLGMKFTSKYETSKFERSAPKFGRLGSGGAGSEPPEVPANAITTEADDPFTTEAGDYFVTES